MVDLTEPELAMLNTLEPYRDGISFKLDHFKPKALKILRQLVASGHVEEIKETEEISHLQLTGKGWKSIGF